MGSTLGSPELGKPPHSSATVLFRVTRDTVLLCSQWLYDIAKELDNCEYDFSECTGAFAFY